MSGHPYLTDLPKIKKLGSDPQNKNLGTEKLWKIAEEYDGETTFSPTNSSKEHYNAEKIPQNNF